MDHNSVLLSRVFVHLAYRNVDVEESMFSLLLAYIMMKIFVRNFFVQLFLQARMLAYH